jgi:hypothetical protein
MTPVVIVTTIAIWIDERPEQGEWSAATAVAHY